MCVCVCVCVAFSSVKYFLQDHDELIEVTGNPLSIVEAAFNNITKEHCVNWICDCGY